MTRVGVLTIGNEVVDGQIINRNASWVSQSLLALGFVVDRHLAVKDGLDEIFHGLKYLAQTCQLIITTGGLGPTIDDCTRQAIAQFLATDLEFSDEQWQAIQQILLARNVIIRPEHRQQAFAPKGSHIISNKFGVAPAFFHCQSQVAIAALPGPPKELQGIWQTGLTELLIEKLRPRQEESLKTWLCFGVAESEVQYLVREAFARTGLNYGFRLLQPYVELKAWYRTDEAHRWQDFFAEIEKILDIFYVGADITFARQPLTNKLGGRQSIAIYDGLTHGLFLEQLRDAGITTQVRKYIIDPAPKTETTDTFSRFLEVSDVDYCVGIFPRGVTSATIVINGKAVELSTYRDIPISSQLGKLVIIEKLFAHGL